MITIEYKNDTLHLTITGSSEVVYQALYDYFWSQCDLKHYSVNGVCYEDSRETVFGLINSNQPFVIEVNRNDVSLQTTLVRSWGEPQSPIGTVQGGGDSDSGRARGTDTTPPHRTG